MADTRHILAETADRILSKACTGPVLDAAEQGTWPEALWGELEESGLVLAATSEARGGFSVELADVCTIVRAVGVHSAPVPLPETLLAERMLAAAGLAPRQGPATVAPVLSGERLTLSRRDNTWALSGVLRFVPWGRDARWLVALAETDAGAVTVAVEHPQVEERASNLAREARDTIRFAETRVGEADVGRPGVGYSNDALRFEGALFRAVAMAGALETVLELTIRYAKERVQFGRPIGKFQAVQQLIAVLASHVAAASAVTQAAVAAASVGPAPLEIAAAKAKVSEAAGIAAAIAHQVHGAIGFTHEHVLHRSTRRLWSWRDEFGGEAEWSSWLGHAVLKEGGRGLWPLLTARETKTASAV
jgi:alkylation response protein AidB-like acyl-CoA dehydrogenase